MLPLGLLAHLPADEIEAILLHELAHIKRRDYLVNLLQNFAETIFFFNPALMWVSSMIREERENCCDDIAIAVTNSKSRFINALIAFQEYNFAGAKYSVGFAGRKNQLLNRVKRIINEKNKTLNAAEKSLLTFGMGVFILFSFAAAKKITPPAVKEVLSSLEINPVKINKAGVLPSSKYDPQVTQFDAAETVNSENDFTYEPVRHDTIDTGLRGFRSYGEVVRYRDLMADTISLIGYRSYGEVVRYQDMTADTTPPKGKRVPLRLSTRTVLSDENPLPLNLKTYSATSDSISSQFTNITSNLENDETTITATHKNGTEYKLRKMGGVVKDFYINGKDFTATVDQYSSIITDIQKAVEYRRQRTKERQEMSRERREEMTEFKKIRAAERKATEADKHLRDRGRTAGTQ
jgi:hypothetical protein